MTQIHERLERKTPATGRKMGYHEKTGCGVLADGVLQLPFPDPVDIADLPNPCPGKPDHLGNRGSKANRVTLLQDHLVRHSRCVRKTSNSGRIVSRHGRGDGQGNTRRCACGHTAPGGPENLGNDPAGGLIEIVEIEERLHPFRHGFDDFRKNRGSCKDGLLSRGVGDPGQAVLFVDIQFNRPARQTARSSGRHGGTAPRRVLQRV